MLSIYTELRRRNVFKVAAVYCAVAWLLLQVSDTLGPALRLPAWFVSAVAFLLILGFPIAIILAWAFELTPDGLRAEAGTEPAESGSERSGGKLNLVVVGAVALALSYFVIDRFVLDSSPGVAGTPGAAQADQPPPAEASPANIDNSIAVLPFVNMSSDAEQEYFSDGLSEELLNLLAGIPELKVAARTSSFSFKGKDLAIPEIATRLNVAHVLEGSVRKHGNQVRITAQLIQADNGYHLWSETYDKEMDNVFQIQEDIARAVVDALKITLLGEAPKIRKTDPEAYRLFLEGQYLKRQITTDSLNRAVDAFRKAVEIDPGYVPAWAELGDTYIWGGGIDKFSHTERGALADQAIEAAISQDPDYAFAYYVRGISWIFVHHQFEKGLDDFAHALELDPDDAFLVAAIGKGALLTGNFDLAIAEYEKALAMEPVMPEFHYFLGVAYMGAERLDDAEAAFMKLQALSPSFRDLKNLIWETLLSKGDLEGALAHADSSFARAVTHHALGNEAEADEALADVVQRASPYRIAMLYGYLGDADKTFEWIDASLETGYFPVWILAETAFRSVYSDERWPLLLEQLGLLEFWQDMAPA